MARTHATAFRRNRYVKDVVFWGRNEAALAALTTRQAGSRFYVDFAELLAKERPQIVSVCLPHHLRAELIVPALRAGADVLCEKPLAMTLEEGSLIKQTSNEEGKTVMIGYVLRFLPEVAELKRIISSGELGEVRLLAFRIGRGRAGSPWLADPGKSLGVFGELGIHGIDLLRYLIADEAVWTSGQTLHSECPPHLCDTGIASLGFRSGAVGTLCCSFSLPFFENDLVVIGTHRTTRVARGRLQVRELSRDYGTKALFLDFLREGFSVPWHYLFENAYQREIDYFVDCVRHGNRPACTVDDDLETLRICLEIQAGSSSRSAPAIPFLSH